MSEPSGRAKREGEGDGLPEWCSRLLLYFAAGLVAWLVVSITVSVISRRMFGDPFAWTLEIAEYALLFITFLGLAAVTRDREHVVVTLINYENMPRLAKVCDTLAQIIGFLIATSFFAISLYVTWSSFETGTRMTRILPIERWVIFSVMPIGSLFWSIEQWRLLKRTWRGEP